MQITATMSSKGQLVIPASLRRKYKLKAGTAFDIGEHNGTITITPRPEDPYEAFLAMRGIMSHIEEDVEGWWMEEKRKEREREDAM
jgi:AbrB family looped-hinge helix DNA binding protein